MRDRNDSRLRRLIRDRVDGCKRRIDVEELASQPFHVAVDRPIARARVVRVRRLEQLIAAAHVTGPLAERLHQQELGDRETHGAPGPRGGVAIDVEGERAGGDARRRRRVGRGSAEARTAQQYFRAREELAHRERLAQVVVGPDLEPEHPIELFLTRGQEDDRQPLRLQPQPSTQLEAVDVGQADVEDHEIRQSFGERGSRRAAIGVTHGAIAGAIERELHTLANPVLVFDDRDRAGRGSLHAPTLSQDAPIAAALVRHNWPSSRHRAAVRTPSPAGPILERPVAARCGGLRCQYDW
jgi:hypothetical protein